MLKPSKKMLFAIEAVLDIAYHAGGTAVQSQDITRRQCIPRRYLEQALQAMVRQGILLGVRGPRGGYRLARERRRISVGDVVRVIGTMEGDDEAGGSELGRRVVRPMWRALHDEMMSRLDALSIDDLCVQADARSIASEGRDSLDFSI